MSASNSSEEVLEEEENSDLSHEESPPPPSSWLKDAGNRKKRLSKQMSLKDSTRLAAWEKRKEQVMRRRRRRRKMQAATKQKEKVKEEQQKQEKGKGKDTHERRKRRNKSLTDEDLDELKGFIDLGFRFNEEGHHDLCNTLPALNLYFAVNRYYTGQRPVTTPTTPVARTSSSPPLKDSPRSSIGHERSETWTVYHPGDDPQHIKTRLRHWAQAVAFSLRQFE